MPFRETFWNIPHWAEIGQYLLAVVTVAVFVYGVFRRVRRWRMGQPERIREPIGRRLGNLFKEALLQLRTAREAYPGVMHLAIFWGMLALALGTALATIDWDVTRLFFGFQFLVGHIYLIFELFLDILGLATLVGLALAAYRRYVIRPARLQAEPPRRARWDDGYVLGILTLIVITGYLVEGLRIAVVQPAWAQWSPVGNLIAMGLASVSEPTNRSLHLGLWILHGLAAFGFVASVPYTKLFHIVAAPLNIFFGRTRTPGALAPRPTSSSPGVASWRDLTWKQLLDVEACIRCGRCQDQCPAHASGLPLSPRDVIIKLEAHLWEPANGHKLHGDVVSTQELWACTSCLACVKACPVFTDQLRAIVDLRRHLVLEGSMDTRLQEALANLGRYGNSFGQSERARAKWTQTIEPKVKDARREPVEYLWFVGDYASYNANLAGITQKTQDVLRHAGLDFGILYDAERNAGNDARRVGEEGLFEMLRDKNLAALSKCEYRVIVTTDPHTYNALKNEYGPELGDGRPILHIAELLEQLISSGKLHLSRKLDGKVTYHDPCYLGRYNGVYDAPRRLIRATGCELVEMPRHADRSYCCGAGGGRIWMDEGEVNERPSESRIREAAGLAGVRRFVVACPKDVTMYQDALKTTGQEARLNVQDIVELVHEAL
jgi:Fe-S oxidoreductase/nitrate reductase gamma subunit